MNTGNGDPKLAAEQRARVLIDRQLADAGWSVQDKKSLNLIAHQGVACREVVMKAGHGRVDYLLYVDRKVVGVIEAKPEGPTLSGVEWQSAVYANGLPAEAELKSITVDGRLPFVFEASGSETHFTNGYDPNPRARRIFNFPTPATLAKQIRDAEADPDKPTWRAKVQHLPPLDEAPLRPAQITALKGIDLDLLKQVKLSDRGRVADYAAGRPDSATYVEGPGIWTIPCHVALPCATQNELSDSDARSLIGNGCIAVAEGANMPTTPDAVRLFQEAGVLFAPGKAANAGGVATSALEMQQNASRDSWSFEHVEERLAEIMRSIHHQCAATADEYAAPGNYVAGANIAGFLRVSKAMTALGLV